MFRIKCVMKPCYGNHMCVSIMWPDQVAYLLHTQNTSHKSKDNQDQERAYNSSDSFTISDLFIVFIFIPTYTSINSTLLYSNDNENPSK